MPEISVEKLTKYYGKYRAVDDISFDYSGNGAIGYLGPNGAGKTTTLKILTHLLIPTSGTVSINGIDVQKFPKKAMVNVGSLIESPAPYPYFTVKDSLNFVGEIRGVNRSDLHSIIADLSEKLKLPPLDARINQISKGQRQRVVLASTMISDPEILILDEPTSGLDPFERKIIRDLINELKKEKLIFMSSHLINEVADTCDQVLFIRQGKIVSRDRVSDINVKFKSSLVQVDFVTPVDDAVKSRITSLGYRILKSSEKSVVISFEGSEEDRANLLSQLMGLGKVSAFFKVGSELEEAYISLLGDGQAEDISD